MVLKLKVFKDSRVKEAGDATLFSVQVMAMEAVSDKESDGSPDDEREGSEKSQEKKRKSSKVRIALFFPLSLFLSLSFTLPVFFHQNNGTQARLTATIFFHKPN